MKRLKYIGLIFAITLLYFSSAYAQVPSPISFQIGGGIGYVTPAGDFNGSTIEYYSGANYGEASGLNIQGKVRLGILGFNIVGEVNRASFSNNGYSQPGQGSVDLSQKVLSFKVGPEFKLGLPLIPFTPYVGANIAINHFSGDVTFQGVSRVPSATYSMKSATRVGLGVSGGVLIQMTGYAIDLGVQYNLLNFSGKSWEDVNPNTDQRLDSYLALNDDKDPAYSAGSNDHFVSSSRTLNSFALTATIMFGL